MSIQALLSRWRADPDVAGNMVAWEVLPATPACLESIPADSHPVLQRALAQGGIHVLFSHQVAALQAAWKGYHVIIATSTASGKTLAYNLPVIDSLLRDQLARALYLFPTKALAQDQLSSLQALLGPRSPSEPLADALAPSIYDGDTPNSSRPGIRKQARIVLSNPDMLHAGILPHHTAWSEFFSNLRYVVIDEMHLYRGVFGSHVANVLRRLRRVARFYGASPQFLLTSATLANPIELAEGLVEPQGEDHSIVLIDQEGAPHGDKHFLIYNPPIIDTALGLRRSALQDSINLATDLLNYQVQTIIFGRSRRTVELLLTYLRQRAGFQESSAERQVPLKSSFKPDDTAQAIRGYRSGYLPAQRREIERGLRQGIVRAVVATNALELGIDIGAMGAALLVGYPGSIAATWQQAGRAGRKTGSALAMLVATPDPLDQFLAAHPEYFFGRSPEQALINPDNLLILLAHMRCAAFELPFRQGEAFGRLEAERVQEFLDFLAQEGTLHPSQGRYFWMADQYPAQAVSLRSASAENVLLQVEHGKPTIIGAIDRLSALWMVHPDAIYLHEGQVYQVQALDLEANIAHLLPVETDYYTVHRSDTSVQPVEIHLQKPVPGGEITYGDIRVTSQVIGYRQMHWQTHQQLGLGELDLPPTELETSAYWLALDDATVEVLRQQGLWNNDPNQYGPGWARQRDRARQRDNFRCQVCGASEIDRAHAVHHKIPFRTFPSAELANQLDNLVTLCAGCHNRVETAVKVRSGLSGLGFVLSHLAPLFLMCDSRDLGVHSDPQAALAAGRPAVVIYDQASGGIGLSQRLFEIHPNLVSRAGELVSECPCSDGCPSCVGPGGEYGLGSKSETRAILDILISKAVLK